MTRSDLIDNSGKGSLYFPRKDSGLVQKGGEGVSPVQNQSEALFWAFFGRFLAFLGLLRAFFGPDNLGKTHLSPESAKKGGDQPFWTSPEIC